MDPIKFKCLADELLALPTGEEQHYRQAASAAYYCAYLKTNDLDTSLVGISLAADSGMHEARAKRLINIPKNNSFCGQFEARQIKALGYILKDMHGLRVKAQYKLADSYKKNEAEELLCKANNYLLKLQELESSIRSSQNTANTQSS